MNKSDIARCHRLLRQRHQLTQQELAARAGIGRWKIVEIEAARIESLNIGEVERAFAALDARLVLTLSYRGAELDRLLDERHAALVAAIVRVLHGLGWETRVEVTFNEYGDRGSIDVVGWHVGRRALVVIEVKSELGSIEGTLRPFSVKCRLAPKIVAAQFGWQPSVVGRILVLPEDRTARRAVDRHSQLLDLELQSRSRALRSWLAQPSGPVAGIWFLSDVGSAAVKRNPSSIRRVRKTTPRSAQSADVGSADK